MSSTERGPVLSRRLSGADAAFLYLERKEIPLHIASVAVFEDAIPFEEFVANIDSRLHLIPRYRQVVVAPPFDVGYPTWEYDRHFDISRHIFQVALPAPGGKAELEALAGRILGTRLDRARPLWDIHVVEGLKGGRGALVVRVHHALADGISGAALLEVMLDSTPEPPRATRPRRSRVPRAATPPASIADAIGSAVQSSVENFLLAEAGMMELARTFLAGRMYQGLLGLTKVLPELMAAVERLPFNRPCGSERKFCGTEVDFADVQAIRAAAGGTVNDVILTVTARAIAKYVKRHGETVAGRFIRVLCPVSLRRGDQGQTLGNRISFLPVVLPLDVRDPLAMLGAVAMRTEIMKSAHAADLVALFAAWMGVTPPPVQAFLWRTIPLFPFPVPLANIICTNVPGSPTPLYTVGKRMIASYPHVPTGHELGVGCAVQSYAGKLFFGLTADAQVAPDVGRLRDFIGDAFAELCRAAGVKKPARRQRAAAAGRKPAVKAAQAAAAEPAADGRVHDGTQPEQPVQPSAESGEAGGTRAAAASGSRA